MAYIIETLNPFEPLTGIERHQHEAGISINEWLRKQYPGFIEFDTPTICVVNGEGLLRKDWDYRIKEKDVVNFIGIPQGISLIIVAIVLAVASIAVTLAFGTTAPATPGEQPSSDPVFSTKGQSNALRLGEPIERCYGKNRIYPSFASRPYFQYVNNDQFQYALFCIGQGEYEINATQIGDSDINDYEEVEFEYYGPGVTPTLFPTSVYTSPEAGGQDLLAPNEDDYVPDGWVGPFVASLANTDSSTIQVDVVFPKGLYRTKSSGNLTQQTVIIEVEIREIDDSGTPIGVWAALPGSPFTITMKTITPQRKTFSGAVASVRYQVRMRRTNTRNIKHTAGNEVQWEGLRSFLTDTGKDFGDVTLLAVKIRATNNLNERTQQRFNVIATAKLIQHQSDGFTSTPLATRSIIWAFVDVFRAAYGGRLTDDTFYDWDALYALDALYESRGEYFDWNFRDPITVWEAAATIARAGRAVPLIAGSLITMVRNGELTTPVAMFTQDNIIAGSFTWDIKLWDLEETDSIRLEYTEPGTGYLQETVLTTLPGGTTDNPRDVRIPGIADRDHGYHEALFILANERYIRENYSFETGLEGYIPTFGDLAIVAHDVPRWSASGIVVRGEFESDGDFVLWLSEPVDFTAAESGDSFVILLTNSKGEVLGPYDVFETTDPQQVRATVLVDIDFLDDGTTEPMRYVFGIAGNVNKYARIVKIEPQGREIMRITCANENALVHSFDGLSAPALESEDTIPVFPELPVVARLTVTQVNSTIGEVLVGWGAAFGSNFYIVQTSEDGTNWDNVTETARTSIQFQVRPGTLYVRVAGVGFGQGPWVSTVLSIGSLVGLDVIQDFVEFTWTVEWLEVLNALSYDVKVYDNTTPSDAMLKRTTNILMTADRTFTYDLDDAVTDGNANREMQVTVTPIFNDGDGEPTPQDFSNPVPAAPTSPSSSLATETSDVLDLEYDLHWVVPVEQDLIRLAVWVSETDGFDPEVESPVLDVLLSGVGYENLPTGHTINVPLDSFGEHGPQRWRVAVFDIWGDEITTNITEQQTIAPTSGWVA
jgi:hypothetical protein